MNRDLLKWSGLAGLVLIIAAAVAYTVQGRAGLAFWIPFGLGAAGLIAYLLENRQEAREILTARKTRFGLNSAFLILLALAGAAFLQAIISNHDLSWDLSKGKLHTLSDEGAKAVKSLDKELLVYGFFAAGDGNQKRYEDLLKRLKKINPSKFRYEFVDPNKRPLLATQYAVRNPGTSVVVSGERNESISSTKEEDLVNAILKVSSSGSKIVYFLSGHGEKSLQSGQPDGSTEFKKALESATFMVNELNLLQTQKVPEDAAAVILAGPRTDYLKPELDLLDAYLGRGGRLVVALDPRARVDNIASWLKKAGVEVGDDVVVDYNPVNQLFGGSPIAPIVNQLDPGHPATKDISENRGQLIVPLARSLNLASPMPAGATGTKLATTFPTAWGYRGSANQIPAKPAATDTKGPMVVALGVEGGAGLFVKEPADPAKQARLVVLGSSSIFANNAITAFNNQDFAVNSVRWLSDEEKRISIAPKDEATQPLMLDSGKMRLMYWSLILLCLGTLASGVIVFVRRRRPA